MEHSTGLNLEAFSLSQEKWANSKEIIKAKSERNKY